MGLQTGVGPIHGAMHTKASQVASEAGPAPTRDLAFVVHLTGGVESDQAHGRVEHVTTGRTARFDSVDELLQFMRQTVASVVGERR